MIRAVLKKGKIQPLEKLPAHWREGQELFTQLLCRLILGTHVIITVQATQHGEKLVGVFQVLTELPSVRVRLSDFRRCEAFGSNQRCAQGNVHIDFALGALRCLW